MVRVYLGRDADSGKRRYYNKTIQGSKKDAQRYLTEKLSERDTGTFVQPATESVASYLERWIESAARGRVRPVTLESYQSLLRNYIVPALGGRRLGQLGPVEIQKLYTDRQRRGLSAKTVRYTHTVLRQALEQAVKWRLLSHNPTTLVSLSRQRRKEMRALDPEETRRFLEAATGDRWSAIWMLLVTTGLRPGEALGLKWSDLEGNRLRIQRTLVRLKRGKGWHLGEPKTPKSRRSVTLPETALRELRRHRARQAEERLQVGSGYDDNGFVFAASNGSPLDQRNLVRRHFMRILHAADLPDIRVYDLRHTCATLLLAAGENPKIVSERLGHSTITLTMDTYSHVLPDMQEATADRLEALLF